jgi:beta-glucuronidase
MEEEMNTMTDVEPVPECITNSQLISLNGPWLFRFDPQNEGLDDRWFAPDAEVEWESIAVPATFNVEKPGMLWAQGAAWYARSLDVPALDGERVIVRFLGAAIRTRVWVNGQEAGGEHLFPYIPFELDVTDLVHEGANALVVRTDNTFEERAIPDKCQTGWWFYGGLYRDVWMELRPEASIEKLWVDTRMAGDSWNLTVHAPVSAAAAGASLNLELRDPGGRVVWTGTGPVEAPESVVEGVVEEVRSWTPEQPNLYTLTAQIGQGHMRQIRVGFRQIEVQGTRVLLNGNPLQLRGICYHEDHPQYGNALPRSLRRQDMERMKATGANFVRLGHYSHDPYDYELADRLGLLVWSEIPAWQTATETLASEEVWERYGAPQLSAMVEWYRHYPSVIFWSVGNEFASSTEPVAAYVRRAAALVKKLDPSRLVSFASDRHRLAMGKDLAFNDVDVIALNEYYGWYYETLYDLGRALDRVHDWYPDKPIMISEMGFDGPIDMPDAEHPFIVGNMAYSLEQQVKSLKSHFEQVYLTDRSDFMVGTAIWAWADFADPYRDFPEQPVQWHNVNLKGLVSLDRRAKPALEMVKKFYHFLAERELSGQTERVDYNY